MHAYTDHEVREYLDGISYGKKAHSKVHDASDTDAGTVCSEWERSIGSWLKLNYPDIAIRENARDVISQDDGNPLELDFYMPRLNLAIEADGERWHDHAGYDCDVRDGTCYTKERLKDLKCEEHGITLVHVWDSQSESAIHEKLRNAVGDARREIW